MTWRGGWQGQCRDSFALAMSAAELVASLCCPANGSTEPHVEAVNRRKRLRRLFSSKRL
jgi:hypothetical protein